MGIRALPLLLAFLGICLCRTSLVHTAPALAEDRNSSQTALDHQIIKHELSTTKNRRHKVIRHDDQCKVHPFKKRLSSPGCSPITATLKGCLGTCVSAAFSSTIKHGVYTSRSHPTMHRRCLCCSPVSTRIGYLTLSCLVDGVSRLRRVAVEVATECKCRPCRLFDG
jgi:hypothetical protein